MSAPARALRAVVAEAVGLLVDDPIVLVSALVGLPIAWSLVALGNVTNGAVPGGALLFVVAVGQAASTRRQAVAKRAVAPAVPRPEHVS